MRAPEIAQPHCRPKTELRAEAFGIPPIYWMRRDDEIVTAKRAADLATWNTRPDVVALAATMTFTDADPTRSIFQGIDRVPNDSMVSIGTNGAVEIESNRAQIDECNLRAIDVAHELWRAVLASVERRIGDAKRIAVLTGGGVDSGALLAAAVARARGGTAREVAAITLHFAGEGDDRPYMRELERAFGIIAVRVDPLDCASGMRDLLDCDRMPIWSPGAATDLELLRRAKESGADVTLTGIGGDDLFDGYPRLLAGDFARGRIGVVMSAYHLVVPWRMTAAQRVSQFIVRPLVGAVVPWRARRAQRRSRHRKHWPWAGPKLRAFLGIESQRWKSTPLATPSERYEFLAKAQYLTQGVELYDELAVRAGVRLEHPFLDAALLKIACAVPPALLLSGGRLRGLFRLAARGAVPDRVRLRPDKASFALARRQMLASVGGSNAFADLATMVECERVGLVDARSFESSFRSFARAVEEDDDSWAWMWPALAVEGFLRSRARLAGA